MKDYSMSLSLLEAEIRTFLNTKSPEILCVFGKWGVGKTFAWNRYLAEAQASRSICLPRYSYVSLFGKSSIQEVREAIVENSVDSTQINLKPSLHTFAESFDEIKKTARFAGSWLVKFSGGIKAFGISGYSSDLKKFFYLALKEQIICIDDIERRNKNLAIEDVMGLTLELKEQKSCKVVLLLNREALEKESEETFRYQIEKVTDVVMEFNPTPKECAEIAVDKTTPFAQWLIEDVQKLGIVNIRVIKKIETLGRRLAHFLAGYDARILQAAIHAVTLGAYSVFQSHEAPPLKFIKGFNQIIHRMNRREKTDEETKNSLEEKFAALLGTYGWPFTDELDNAIFDAVERGYFDEQKICFLASKNARSLSETDKQNKFTLAWDLFFNSFDTNDSVVLDAIYAAFKECYVRISPLNANSTIMLFKRFDQKGRAIELLDFYVRERKEDYQFWRLDSPSISMQGLCPELVAAFEKKYQELRPRKSLYDTLILLGSQQAWSSEDSAVLREASTDEYYNVLKTASVENLPLVHSAIKMIMNDGVDDSGRDNLTSALERIGAESPMNRERVARYLPKRLTPDLSEPKAP
jgi:hypothetical protein